MYSQHKGIYYVGGSFPFPAQIIATGELDKKPHMWLKSLSRKLNKEDIQDLLDKIDQMTEKNDREMAGSVLEVSIEANRQMVEKWIGDDYMFETLMEIMEPRIMEVMGPKMEEVRQESRKEGIKGTVEILRNLNHKDSEIKSAIMAQYDLTEETADKYLKF